MSNYVGKKYTRNSIVAEVTSHNSKFKTVILKFADGKEQSISTSTLAKHWVEVTEDIPTQEITIEEEPKVEVKDAPVEVAPVVETPKEQVIKKAPKEKKNRTHTKRVDLGTLDKVADVLTSLGYAPTKSTRYVGCKGFQFYKRNTRVRVYGKTFDGVSNTLYTGYQEEKHGASVYVDYDNLEAFLKQLFA